MRRPNKKVAIKQIEPPQPINSFTGIYYIPKVHCSKCDSPVDSLNRVHNSNNERYLRAQCHGEETHVAFSMVPNATVSVFG